MAYGILDTKFIDFPPNIDQSYLRGLQTRGGVSFSTVLTEIDARLGTLNASLDPLVANLMTVTTEAYTEDGAPVAFEVTERGEYTLARPQLVEGQGLMIPLRSYDVSIGFTEDGLERMSQERIMRNVDSVLLGLRRLHKVQALTRLFSNAEIRVAKSTTSTSPGFAGSGTGDNVFSRPYPDGTALPGGYTHYYVAERSIRPLVVLRKISGGSRSENGSHTRMALASLFGTWTARQLNPFLTCLTILQSPPHAASP